MSKESLDSPAYRVDETAQAVVPIGDPMRDAWEAYSATPEYANTKSWAIHREHVDGSLWAAFVAGWKASREGSGT